MDDNFLALESQNFPKLKTEIQNALDGYYGEKKDSQWDGIWQL
jgi:hypothetical protein